MRRGTMFILIGMFIDLYFFINTTELKYLVFSAIVGSSFILAGVIQNIASYIVDEIKDESINLLGFIGKVLKQIAENIKKEDN